MTTQQKWKLVAAGAAVVAVAAGGAAIASTHHSDTAFAAVSPRPLGPGGMPGRGLGGDPLSAASTYLGVSTADLFAQLRSGKTLAAIADATPGKSAAGLVDALVAAQKQQLEQAVTDGRLTRDQADRIESDLQQRVTAQVNGTFRHPPRRFGPTLRGTA